MDVGQCQARVLGHDLVGSLPEPFVPDGDVLHLDAVTSDVRFSATITGTGDDVFPAAQGRRSVRFSALVFHMD